MKDCEKTKNQLISELENLRLENTFSDSPGNTRIFKSISDNAAYGCAVTDLQGNVVYVNNYMSQIHGYDKAELTGRNLSVFHNYKQMERVSSIYETLGQNGSFSNQKVEHIHKDGSVFTMLMNGTVINNSNGEPEYFATSASDITEMINNENALREEQELYRLLADNSSDLIWITGTAENKFPLIYVNPTVKRMLGFSAKEAMQLPMENRITAESLVSFKKAIDNINKPGGKAVLQIQHIHRNGEFVICETVVHPVFDSHGRQTGYQGRAVSINERVKKEQEREAHLYFLKKLSEIDQYIRQSSNTIQMLSRVLPVIRSVFSCDRVWLIYPCDPTAEKCSIPFECSRTWLPGKTKADTPFQVTPELSSLFKEALSAEGIVPGEDPREGLPSILQAGSRIHAALYPQTGSPWLLGMNQSTGKREWTQKECFMFQQMSLRLSNALSGQLLLQNLRTSEASLKQAQSLAGMGSWSLDIATGKMQWSEEMYNIFEIPFEEDIDVVSRVNSLLHPEDKAAVRQSQATAIATGDMKPFEFRIILKDGRIKHLLSRGKVFLNRNGEPEKLTGSDQDITSRKIAEQAQNNYLKFLENLGRIDRVIVQSSGVEPLMKEVLDTALNIFQADRAWLLYPCDPEASHWSVPMECTKPGFPGVKASGESIPMLPEISEVFRKVLEVNDVVTVDSFHVSPQQVTDERFHTRARMQMPVHPGTGKPWMFGLHQCTHHRKWNSEEQSLFREIGHRLGDALSNMLLHRDLMESKNRLSSFIESATDAFMLFDSNLRLMEVNGVALRILHAGGRSDVIGRKLIEIAPYTKKTGRYKAYLKVLETGESVSFPDYKASDRFDNLHLSLKAFKVGDGLGIIFSDITEFKNAEDARLNLERQVQHAQKLESLGVLAGGIAHDFNNILMAILGNADLALVNLSTANPAFPNVKEIERSARRAADLSRQMLAYSGKGKFLIEKISLNEAVDEITHILEVSTSKKAIIRFCYTEDLPLIEGDATQIRQVVMNLVTNASDAIGNSNGVISLTTGTIKCDSEYLQSTYINEMLPCGNYVFLEVTDTGCGMNNETLEKLFDPFYTTKFTGRGLGLAAVLGIIRGHHGAIKVNSKPGRGTSVKVLFPRCKPASIEESVEESKTREWTGSGTVLLVDDEDTILSISQQMLNHIGFDVVTASDGCEAIDKFGKNPDTFVLAIVDLTMPNMDGEETFRELRSIRKNIPVLMSSGYNEQEVTRRFEGRSLSGFIHKPYTLKMLKKKVEEILGR